MTTFGKSNKGRQIDIEKIRASFKNFVVKSGTLLNDEGFMTKKMFTNYRTKVMVVPYMLIGGQYYVLMVKHIPKHKREKSEWTCISGGAPNTFIKAKHSTELANTCLNKAFTKEFQQETKNCIPKGQRRVSDVITKLESIMLNTELRANIKVFNNLSSYININGEGMYSYFLTRYHPERFNEMNIDNVVSFYHVLYVRFDAFNIFGTEDIEKINSDIRTLFFSKLNLTSDQIKNPQYNETSDIRFFDLDQIGDINIWSFVREYIFPWSKKRRHKKYEFNDDEKTIVDNNKLNDIKTVYNGQRWISILT